MPIASSSRKQGHPSPCMKKLNDNIDLDQFFTQLRSAPQRLLMLDYDGTLAPFTSQRGNATPYPAIIPVLQALNEDLNGRTVVISGRAIADLLPLLPEGFLPEIWGSHGWEHRRADGSMVPPDLDSGTRRQLDIEWEWLCAHVPSDQTEKKPTSVALHWRGLETDTQSALRALAHKRWKLLYKTTAVEMHIFDGGVELRANGRSKAHAVEALLAEYSIPPAAAYLGDDRTDEDAFLALGNRGLRILVREEFRPTNADIQLAPPEELKTFLEQWHKNLL